MNLQFLVLHVVLFGCMSISSANSCCNSFSLCPTSGPLQNTGIFDISLSCYNSTIYWNKTKDSIEYYLSLHETCYNVTTGEMLPDYPNCVIEGKSSSGNKSIRRIGEFDDIVCSYGGCIFSGEYGYCDRNIPHIGNCTNPTQITHVPEQASSSSLSYSSSAAVSLSLSISTLPSSLEDFASFSSTYIVSSSSIHDSKTTSSFSMTNEASGTRESYNVSTSFISLFPSISSPIVSSTATLANGSLDLIYVLVIPMVTVLLCISGLFVILFLLIAKKKLKPRSKLTTDLIFIDGPRIELFFEDLKGSSLQSGSMETVYTPLEGSCYGMRGHIDTRDKESVVTAASSENLNENKNEEFEKMEEDGNELGGVRDESTIVSSENSNASSYVSSGSSGFGNDDPGHLPFHGLTQLNNGYVESSGSVVESSGQSHEYVQLKNAHMVETTNRSTGESNGCIQTKNESVKSHKYIKEESSGQSYGYIQVNTGHVQMNVRPETNGSILSNGYIQTNEGMEMMKFNGHTQSKSFITSDIKFENDYIPNNFM